MKRKLRPKSKDKGERPADLLFWFKDGMCGAYCARVKADAEVSIGRTNSKRAIGFIVTAGRERTKLADFVLNKDQVAELAAYLQLMRGALRRPPGRKPPQLSVIPWAEEMRRPRSGRA